MTAIKSLAAILSAATKSSTAASWTVIGTATATVGITAAIITPRMLRASGGDALSTAVVPTAAPQHEQLINHLTQLIARSHEVLAVHQRGTTPFLEITLWLDDGKNPGVPDPGEIAVLSHSGVLQTLTWYTLDESLAPFEADTNANRAWWKLFRRTMSDEALRSPAFCEQWRANEAITSSMMARGIEKMEANVLGPGSANGALLQITLTWSADSADGPDSASAVVDAVIGPARRPEEIHR